MSSCDSVTELNATFKRHVELYNGGDLASYFDLLHDDVVYSVPNRSTPLVGKDEVRDWYITFLGGFESVVWESDTQFWVVGSTGIGMGRFTQTARTSDSQIKRWTGTHTVVFSKIDGEWMKVGEQASL